MATKVTKDNYRQFCYYSDKPLNEHTDEELKARKFYITKIYKNVRGPLAALRKLERSAIWHEENRRKLVKSK